MKYKFLVTLFASIFLAVGCTVPPSVMYHQSKPYESLEDFNKGFQNIPGDPHPWKDIELRGTVVCLPSKDGLPAGCKEGLESPDGKYYDLDLDSLNASARLPASKGDTITLVGKVSDDGAATSHFNISGTIKVWITK